MLPALQPVASSLLPEKFTHLLETIETLVSWQEDNLHGSPLQLRCAAALNNTLCLATLGLKHPLN